MNPLSKGDVLFDEDTGSVYIFKRYDTMGRIVAVATGGNHGVAVLDPIPANLWRYDRQGLVKDIDGQRTEAK